MIPAEVLDPAVRTMLEGGTLLYPTDTIWGLGCDATNAHAVEKVGQIKQRDPEHSMLILVDTMQRLQSHVGTIPPEAVDLMEQANKPVTIVYPSALGLPDVLLAPDLSIAIRLTKDPFCKALIAASDRPLVSTSANISGQPFPLAYKEISPQLVSGVDHVVGWRQDEYSEAVPSAILKIDTAGKVNVIRE